jgi:hypothetical protein
MPNNTIFDLTSKIFRITNIDCRWHTLQAIGVEITFLLREKESNQTV